MKKFFSEPSTALVMLTSGFLGFVVGIANGVIQKRHGGWSAFFSTVASGTVVAVIIGLTLTEYVKSEALRYAVIAVCAIVSDDILAGFRTLGAMFRNNPFDALSRLLDALRGRPAVASLPQTTPTPKED